MEFLDALAQDCGRREPLAQPLQIKDRQFIVPIEIKKLENQLILLVQFLLLRQVLFLGDDRRLFAVARHRLFHPNGVELLDEVPEVHPRLIDAILGLKVVNYGRFGFVPLFHLVYVVFLSGVDAAVGDVAEEQLRQPVILDAKNFGEIALHRGETNILKPLLVFLRHLMAHFLLIHIFVVSLVAWVLTPQSFLLCFLAHFA